MKIFCKFKVLLVMLAAMLTILFTGCISGFYTRQGNTAQFFYNDPNTGNQIRQPVTISGNTATLSGGMGSATRITQRHQNPFVGAWAGEAAGEDEDVVRVEIIFANSTFMIGVDGNEDPVPYSRRGNTAFVTNYQTGAVIMTFTLSGDTMTLELGGTASVLNRVAQTDNPFVGRWRLTTQRTTFEVVVGQSHFIIEE
jgi:hypothetical protein